ncbi:MAG: hypothetical protein DRO36_04885 [Candidatus Hecatellales archaeon]|nr:MAG: hypothetical protein DRO36_04885 [Candidatus Hecatellales archaeon]
MVKQVTIKIMFLMAFFWAVFNFSSWILAKVYMPWVKGSLLRFSPVLADLVVWFTVLVVLGFILLGFKKLFYTLFWYEFSSGLKKR